MTEPSADQLVCVDVVAVSRLLSVLMSERLAAVNVSLGQLPTLLALYETDGLTQAELARSTGVEQPTMAVNLQRMERDGLVRRVPDPVDRRRSLVRLTPRAQRIRGVVQSQRQALDDAALHGIPAGERAVLRSVLGAMVANLESVITSEPTAP